MVLSLTGVCSFAGDSCLNQFGWHIRLDYWYVKKVCLVLFYGILFLCNGSILIHPFIFEEFI
jgi:hypothetical protein